MNNTPYYPKPDPNITKAPGRNLLLVTGILFIVFNAIGAMTIPFTLLTIEFWLPMFGGEAMRYAWIFVYVAGILLSLFAVVVGILGVAFCNKPDRAGVLIGLAVMTIVLSILYNIVYAANILSFSDGLGIFTVITIPVTLVLPVLYIAGAAKNKKAADFADQYGYRGQR